MAGVRWRFDAGFGVATDSRSQERAGWRSAPANPSAANPLDSPHLLGIAALSPMEQQTALRRAQGERPLWPGIRLSEEYQFPLFIMSRMRTPKFGHRHAGHRMRSTTSNLCQWRKHERMLQIVPWNLQVPWPINHLISKQHDIHIQRPARKARNVATTSMANFQRCLLYTSPSPRD